MAFKRPSVQFCPAPPDFLKPPIIEKWSGGFCVFGKANSPESKSEIPYLHIAITRSAAAKNLLPSVIICSFWLLAQFPLSCRFFRGRKFPNCDTGTDCQILF